MKRKISYKVLIGKGMRHTQKKAFQIIFYLFEIDKIKIYII